MWIADSYAKINLGLNVLERLPTGNYRTETGLCFIDWRDRFEVSQADKMKVNISNPEDNSGAAEFVEQAIEALNRYVGLKNSYHFNIDKRIPADSGLGSRASNAALTMRMLNKLEGLKLNTNDLIDISRNISPDISSFINGEPGISRGAEQHFEPLNIQPNHWLVTCFPSERSDTAAAYERVQPKPEPDYPLKKTLLDDPIDEWRYVLSNDLEQSVFQQVPLPGNLKDQFYEFGALYASMVGAGTAVFGLFEQNFVAVDAYKTLIRLGHSANLTKPGFSPDYGIYRKG